MNKDEIKVSIKEHLMSNYGKNIEEATKENIYNAAALSLRDAIMEKWAEYKRTQQKEKKKEQKRLWSRSTETAISRSSSEEPVSISRPSSTASISRK